MARARRRSRRLSDQLVAAICGGRLKPCGGCGRVGYVRMEIFGWGYYRIRCQCGRTQAARRTPALAIAGWGPDPC